MYRGTLNHALEGGRRHGLGAFDIRDERRQIVIDEIDKNLAQRLQFDTTSLHDLRGIGLVDEREEKMFQCGQLVLALICFRQRGVDGLFQRVRKRRHLRAPFFRWRRRAGARILPWPHTSRL